MSPNGSLGGSNEKGSLYGPWRQNNPAKRGYNKTLNPFPQYQEERDAREDRDALREKYLKHQKKEKIWIPNTFEWTKPSVSINQHFRNAGMDKPNI